jgi:hypothetical protein
MGDQVRSMIKGASETMLIDAAPITAGGNMSASALPLIGLTITAPTAAQAQSLSQEVPAALERYLAKEQSKSDTPLGDRVEIQIVNRSQVAIPGKSKAMMTSIVVFMMALAAAVALAYILENLRHSSRTVDALADRRGDSAPEHKQVPMREAKPIARAETASNDGGWASGPPNSASNRFSSGNR